MKRNSQWGELCLKMKQQLLWLYVRATSHSWEFTVATLCECISSTVYLKLHSNVGGGRSSSAELTINRPLLYFQVYFPPTSDISLSPMGLDTAARSKRLTFRPTAFNGGDRRKTTGVDVLVPLRPSSPSPWDLSIQILATALCSGGCHPVHLFLGFKEPCLSSAQRLLRFVKK